MVGDISVDCEVPVSEIGGVEIGGAGGLWRDLDFSWILMYQTCHLAFVYDSVLTWLYMWLSFQLFVCALNFLFAISIFVLSPITKKGGD